MAEQGVKGIVKKTSIAKGMKKEAVESRDHQHLKGTQHLTIIVNF